MPCFGNSPSPWVTWQRPQMPRPPQTESMSTPSERPDGHDQRVDHDVRARDAVVGGPLDDPFGDREPDVGVHADPGVVVADRDDRGAVLADERQDALEALLFPGDRIEQGLALVD